MKPQPLRTRTATPHDSKIVNSNAIDQLRAVEALIDSVGLPASWSVVGTHRSKGVELPVVTIEYQHLGVSFTLRDNFHDVNVLVRSDLPIAPSLPDLYEEHNLEWYQIAIARKFGYTYRGWTEEQADNPSVHNLGGKGIPRTPEEAARWMARNYSCEWYSKDWSSGVLIPTGPDGATLWEVERPFDHGTRFFLAHRCFLEGIECKGDEGLPYSGKPVKAFSFCYNNRIELLTRFITVVLAAREEAGRRRIILSRGLLDGNVSVRVTDDGGATVRNPTDSELERISNIILHSGWSQLEPTSEPASEVYIPNPPSHGPEEARESPPGDEKATMEGDRGRIEEAVGELSNRFAGVQWLTTPGHSGPATVSSIADGLPFEARFKTLDDLKQWTDEFGFEVLSWRRVSQTVAAIVKLKLAAKSTEKTETSEMTDQDRIKLLEDGLMAVLALIDESKGVVGLHQNGDHASWEELRTGGEFEDWLAPFDRAVNSFQKEKAAPQHNPQTF